MKLSFRNESLSVEREILERAVVPMMMQGAEIRSVRKEGRRKLDGIEMNF